jgi:hypothetical protein
MKNLSQQEKHNHTPLFDKAFLINFDKLIELHRLHFPESKVDRTKIEKYVKNDYFPELYLENGEKGFILDSINRIEFISAVLKKWGYNKNELRVITKGEDFLIFEVLDIPSGESDKLNYKLMKQLLNGIKSLKNKDPDHFSYLCIDCVHSSFISEYRAEVLLGFSPHLFPPYFSSFDEVTNSERLLKYPYKYSDGTMWFYFGEISPQTKELNNFIPSEDKFYATPDFYIGYDKNRAIKIRIRNLKIVTSIFMKNIINKFYTKIRSSLDVDRAEYGLKTGRKKQLKQRNEELKKRYAKRRNSSNKGSADEDMEKVASELEPEFGFISLETARRNIYSKK